MDKETRKKILKVTFEILTTPLDLILFLLLMGLESPGDYTMRGLQKKLDKLIDKGQDRILRNAISRARKEDWIEKDFKLTSKGEKRIKRFLPEYLSPPPWNGKWYLVSFDIPERMRRKRDILRENLKKLGFGQLHASCWVSVINHLSRVEEIVNFYQLFPCVILAESNKLGREDSKTLADRIWKLKKINQQYLNFISKWKKVSPKERYWLQFEYLNILRKDPQLPKELLPKNWQGEKAYQLWEKLKNQKKERKN